MDQLALFGGTPISQSPISFTWPILTSQLENAILEQARNALSVYDGGNVVGRFERAFGAYLDMPFVLATSSGTAALYSLFYSQGWSPDDEIIVSDYGFFATATPLLLFGAKPVFVDCGDDGNLAANMVAESITPKTRGVVVTHMWGAPAPVDDIAEVCSSAGIVMFEDCSHAHGSRINGRLVGTFGDAAAWSLQSGKSLWAGEGGVLATHSRTIYERALLVGHFNRRAMQDIPPESPNAPYAFTGTGLKFRSHPLGLALAAEQVSALDDLILGRQGVASLWIDAMDACPGMRVLSRTTARTLHSYYSLTVLIDPNVAGFDADTFVAALRAENITCVSRPSQMRRLSTLPVFRAASKESQSHSVLSKADKISERAVSFFVPSQASEGVSWDSIELVGCAIRKVISVLSNRSK